MYSIPTAQSPPSVAASVSPLAVPQQSSRASDAPSLDHGSTIPAQSAVSRDCDVLGPSDPVIADAAGHGQGASAAASHPSPAAHTRTDDSAAKPSRVQCGVGVYLKLAQEGFVEVKATEPGCSADSLLFVGDILTAVDGTSCVGMSLRDVTRLIVGEEGSCVTISVMREFAVSPATTKTVMREVPVLLTRRPLPQQRTARAVKELSTSLQTPRGQVQQQTIADSNAASQLPARTRQLPPPSSSLSVAASVLEALEISDNSAPVPNEVPMRQFFVSNVGSLPLKLTVFDCDDVLRVSELVTPLSQYPLEHNTCAAAVLAIIMRHSFASHTADICRCRPVKGFGSCFRAA